MKQTPIEWLENEFQEMCKDFGGLHTDFIERFEQAKAMEKEQHQETFKQSRQAKIFEQDMPPVWESWEQYYNETFKSE